MRARRVAAVIAAWTLLGLGTVAARASEGSWIPVGPPGGSVRALAADPRAADRVYLGTTDGMLYRSDDGGRQWRRLTPGFPHRGCSLEEILVDPRGVVHVGYWEVHGTGGGVARSTDGGETFTIVKAMAGESVRALALAPSNPRWIAAGTLSGVFLSRDGGGSWTRISPAGDAHLRNLESLAFDPYDPRVLYAGTRHLAWKTDDGGATWQPIHRGMIDDSHVMSLTVDSRYRRNVFATACTGIYRSTDGGANWTKLGGIPESSRRTRSFRLSEDGVSLLLAGTTEGLWISEDRGARWRHATPKELVVNALLLQPDGTILLGTEEEGVLRSEDRGRTWNAGNDGFTERFVSRLLFDGARERVFAAVWGGRPGGGVFVAPDLGGPWTRFAEGLAGRQVLAMALLDDAVYAGTDDGVFVMRPDARVWTRLPARLEGREIRPRITELIVTPAGRLVAASAEGLIVSGDRGRTWVRAALGDAPEVTALAACPADPDVIVAATRTGFLRSPDAGETWERVAPPLAGRTPHVLAFIPTQEPVLLAATSGGLYESRDRGATWRAMSGGIPHSDLTGLAVHPDGRTIFASDFTRGGVFRSADAGATWERMTTRGLASDRVWMLGLDPRAPERLLAASPGGGLHLIALVAAARDTSTGTD